MAVKTFTTGEVLTAADTNTYLNNGGLVYIKSQTIGTAVSSVTVSSAFSADFDAYRVTVTGMVCSAGDNTIFIRPGGDTTAASYFSGGYFVKYDGTGNGWLIQNGTASGISVCITDTSAQAFAFDIFSPFLTQRTRASGISTGLAYVAHYQGYHNQATSYTSFTMVPNSGTMTGGTIRLYGYRQA